MAALSGGYLHSCRANRVDLHLMLCLLEQRGLKSASLFEIDPTVIKPLDLGVEPLKFRKRFLAHSGSVVVVMGVVDVVVVVDPFGTVVVVVAPGTVVVVVVVVVVDGGTHPSVYPLSSSSTAS